MKVLQANFAQYITDTLASIKKGCYDINATGDVVLRLPDKVDFQVELVCASAYNTITRTDSVTPSANRVTTTVDASYSETTTRTPATTQTDDSSQGGSDGTTTTTTYSTYTYTTP